MTVADAADVLTSDTFRKNAHLFLTEPETVTVKATFTNSIAERFHDPFRRAFRKKNRDTTDG